MHSAKMPESLANRFVRHLTEEGQVVLDHYSGTGTTPEACELTGRRWFAIERVWEYVRQSFRRFDIHNIDYWVNPAFLAAQNEF
ncbi:DNA methyltransferase [Vibrio rotiferianus]